MLRYLCLPAAPKAEGMCVTLQTSLCNLQVVQLIPLNGVGACIRRGVRYPKAGGAVEGPRRDARAGVTRSLMTICPKGYVHIRFVFFIHWILTFAG